MKSKHSFCTVINGIPRGTLVDYDFIANNCQSYWYLPNIHSYSRILDLHKNAALRVLHGWLYHARHHPRSFSWDLLCKFALIRHSLNTEDDLRFPLSLDADFNIVSGYGRLLSVIAYRPDIVIDGLVCGYLDPIHSRQNIQCFAEYEKILLKKKYWCDFDFTGKNWIFKIDTFGKIHANDICDHEGGEKFPFCETSTDNSTYLRLVQKIVNSNKDDWSVFLSLCDLDVITASPEPLR